MNRRSLAWAIVLLWVGTFGWLLQRQFSQAPSRLMTEAALRIPPGAAYFGLELGNTYVGFLSTKVDTLPDTLLVQSLLILDVPTPDGPKRIETRTSAVFSRTLELRTFEAAARGYEGEFAIAGEISGDTILNLEIESLQTTFSAHVQLHGPVVLPSVLPVYLAFRAKPVVGDTLNIDVFDPLSLRLRNVNVSVIAESTLIIPDSATYDSTATRWVPARWDTLQAWKITQSDADGTTPEFTSWIDELGQLVRSNYPTGVSINRTAFEIAFNRFQKHATSDNEPSAYTQGSPIRRTPLAAGVRPGSNTHLLRAVVNRPHLTQLILNSATQSLDGDTLTVRMVHDSALAARYGLPAQLPEFSQHLQPEPLIQSEDVRVQSQARQIVANLSRRRRRNPVRVARLLVQWVSEQVQPSSAPTAAPSALETLQTRLGDSNEHAVLFVALARASGIPARTAAGLVYLGGDFYYHAWAEIFLNGWVPVDPTFGQFPADAAHIQLSRGGLARQVESMMSIGHLQLHLLRADSDK